jgi:calcium-dependent protein kinase
MGPACSSTKNERTGTTQSTIKPTEKNNSHSPSKSPEKQSSPKKTGSKGETPIISKTEDIKIDTNLLANNDQVNPMDHYEILEDLGEKPYGNLFLVKHQDAKQKRLMKEISGVEKGNEAKIREKFDILKKFDHPKIVKIYENYSYNGIYFIVTEFFKKGNLEQIITQKKFLKENQVANIIYQILLAINYAHSSEIMHRDLKPENVMIEEVDTNEKYTVNVIDFGTVSSIEKFLKNNQKIGSVSYMAPEVIDTLTFDKKCDLWSCGIMTYYLLSGTTPFQHSDDSQMIQNIKTAPLKFTGKCEKVSSLCKDFMKKLIERDPKKRLSAFDALNHGWFVKFQLKDKNTIIETTKLNSFMNNLVSYNSEFKLQQVCVALIVHNLPSTEDVKELEKAFTLMDINLDGKLTKEELITGFKTIYKNKENYDPVKEVEKIFKNVDNDKTGFISYEEFICACIDKHMLLTEKYLKFAFSCFDDNNSGFITSKELGSVLSGGGENKISQQMLNNVMKDIDVDIDGKMSFAEFKLMMEKILK